MDGSALSARLERLERTVRRQRVLLGLLLLAPLARCGGAPTSEIVLRSADGEATVTVTADENGPAITLLDGTGATARLGIDAGAPMLRLAGQGGEASLTTQSPGAMLMACDDQRRCAQVYAGAESRGLILADSADQVSLRQLAVGGQLSLRQGETRADLKLIDGRPELDLASALGGAKVRPGVLEASDADGTPRARLDGITGAVSTAPEGSRILRKLD